MLICNSIYIKGLHRQLFCTFTARPVLDLTIDYIKSFFEITNNRIFLYKEWEDYSNLFLIYNVDGESDGFALNTIPVHRNKQTNTFFTINALNNLIKRINNGVLDTTYKIDWANYEDTILTGKKDELFITEIIFEKKISL